MLPLQVPVFMRRHLCQAQHGVLARQAVIMSLLAAVLAARGPALLARGELLEAGCLDRVELLVLPSVGDDLVRVGADEVALQAVEMGRLVLGRAWKKFRLVFVQECVCVGGGGCSYLACSCRRTPAGRRTRWRGIVGNPRPLGCRGVRAGQCAGRSASCRRTSSRNPASGNGSAFGARGIRSAGTGSPR